MTIKAVDLFCGIGGLTYGLQKAGIPVVAGIDIDDSCEYAYTHNNNCKFIKKSVDDVTGKEVRALLRGAKIKILVGCAPCQPFSSHQKDKQNRSKHKDWKLLYQFGRLVKEVKPHIVSMENVPELEKEKVFSDFIKTLNDERYIVNYKVVNVADYGVPQRRRRLILLASRKKEVDIFELTELPDMALSNRQGYKSDDPRYQVVLNYVRKELLPDILKKRDIFVALGKKKKEDRKLEQQRQNEASFRKSVDSFRRNTAKKAAKRISSRFGITAQQSEEVETILSEEINTNSPDMGIKSIVDAQKKKILISQTYPDKDLADVVYSMLVFNNVPPEDIIYTNCDNEVSRIPEGDVGQAGIYDYLRDFFVDSYSTQKMYVIFVTSHNTRKSWGALTEVGAAWITQIEHKIFNIYDFRPEHPLDDEQQWHSSSRDANGDLCMSKLSIDIFAQKIEYICDKMGYRKRSRQENKDFLETLVRVTMR